MAGKPAEARFAALVQAFAGDPDVTHDERLFSSRPLKVRGKVFAMLVQGNLVVKLPRGVVDRLVSGGEGTRFDPGHGRVMKEWVVLPPAADERWLDLAREARAFVAGARAG